MLNRKSFVAVVVIFCGATWNHAQAEFQPGEFITYSQEGWGGDPGVAGSGAQLLLFYFDLVFPNGTVQIGLPGNAGFSIVFTSPVRVLDFLPGNGGTGQLTSDLTDPATSSAGVFAGYTLALQLDVDFAAAGLLVGSAGTRFEDLVFHDLVAPYPQDLNGTTVREVVTELNLLLGGGTGPHSIDGIGVLTDRLSRAFEGGVPSQFAQDHLRIVPEPATGVLVLLVVITATLNRWRRAPHGIAVRFRQRFPSAITVILLAVSLLLVETTRVQAGFVRGYARAAQTWEGGAIFSDDDSDSASLSEGRAVTGSAFQINGGSASFSIDPTAGAGGVNGYSVPITYDKYIVNRLGSQVEGYIVLQDSFTIDGPIPDNFGVV